VERFDIRSKVISSPSIVSQSFPRIDSDFRRKDDIAKVDSRGAAGAFALDCCQSPAVKPLLRTCQSRRKRGIDGRTHLGNRPKIPVELGVLMDRKRKAKDQQTLVIEMIGSGLQDQHRRVWILCEPVCYSQARDSPGNDDEVKLLVSQVLDGVCVNGGDIGFDLYLVGLS
jgi:hypothetical protein